MNAIGRRLGKNLFAWLTRFSYIQSCRGGLLRRQVLCPLCLQRSLMTGILQSFGKFDPLLSCPAFFEVPGFSPALEGNSLCPPLLFAPPIISILTIFCLHFRWPPLLEATVSPMVPWSTFVPLCYPPLVPSRQDSRLRDVAFFSDVPLRRLKMRCQLPSSRRLVRIPNPVYGCCSHVMFRLCASPSPGAPGVGQLFLPSRTTLFSPDPAYVQ